MFQPEARACACCTPPAVNAPRRRIITIAATGLAAPLALLAAEVHTKPADGDRLVEDEAEGTPSPLRLADIPIGKPVLVFPFDSSRNAVRDGSRLNKLVLMRFAMGDLDAESRARSAGGVLAFSAICTHQACDVKTWLSKEKRLVCYCHASKFALLDGGTVTSGPATRALPAIPLALDGDLLVIAGPFTAPPGASPA